MNGKKINFSKGNYYCLFMKGTILLLLLALRATKQFWKIESSRKKKERYRYAEETTYLTFERIPP